MKIEPFAEGIKREGKISYGCSSYGYDMRLGYIFDVFSPINATEIDPKNFDKKMLVRKDLTPGKCSFVKHPTGPRGGFPEFYCSGCKNEVDTPYDRICAVYGDVLNYLLIPPHSFVLGESVETFEIPRDMTCIVIGKSTYARCGLIVNVTPLEALWKGKVTIELSNTTPLPMRVYCGEGIAQCVFIRSDAVRPLPGNKSTGIEHNGTCLVSYADKQGKYQDQKGLTHPIVDSSTSKTS